MVAWWLSLSIGRQIALFMAMASSLIIIIDFVLFTINFYGVDRLNVETDDLNQYEMVANNDSDMSKNKHRVVTVKSLNVFVAVTCWLYFYLWLVLSGVNLIIISVVGGLFVACVDSIFIRYKKNL